MIFQQKFGVNWNLLKKQRQVQAVANNHKKNKNRLKHKYKVNNLVLIVQKPYERAKIPKFLASTEGPYKILKIYTNRNVRIRYGRYNKDINTCRLHPYFQKS